VDGLGYMSGQGLGLVRQAMMQGVWRAGGTYHSSPSSTTYGSITAPENLGSGGNTGGAHGGGLLF